jgi:hypothetical protein
LGEKTKGTERFQRAYCKGIARVLGLCSAVVLTRHRDLPVDQCVVLLYATQDSMQTKGATGRRFYVEQRSNGSVSRIVKY